jgi:putative transposase
VFFNNKCDRIGRVFQGRYKAVIIGNDTYLLHLSRYIHLNPIEYTKNLTEVYSSYADYLHLKKTAWVKLEIIFKFFNNSVIPDIKTVNNYKRDSSRVLEDLTLE